MNSRAPILFWVVLAYLHATVIYNLWVLWSRSTFPSVELGANLGLKILAIAFLFFRRGVAAHLLAAAFAVGLGDSMLQWRETDGSYLPSPLHLLRFAIPLLVVIYVFILKWKGFLSALRIQNPAAAFD